VRAPTQPPIPSRPHHLVRSLIPNRRRRTISQPRYHPLVLVHPHPHHQLARFHQRSRHEGQLQTLITSQRIISPLLPLCILTFPHRRIRCLLPPHPTSRAPMSRSCPPLARILCRFPATTYLPHIRTSIRGSLHRRYRSTRKNQFPWTRSIHCSTRRRVLISTPPLENQTRSMRSPGHAYGKFGRFNAFSFHLPLSPSPEPSWPLLYLCLDGATFLLLSLLLSTTTHGSGTDNLYIL
jgi:hypothetical protein